MTNCHTSSTGRVLELSKSINKTVLFKAHARLLASPLTRCGLKSLQSEGRREGQACGMSKSTCNNPVHGQWRVPASQPRSNSIRASPLPFWCMAWGRSHTGILVTDVSRSAAEGQRSFASPCLADGNAIVVHMWILSIQHILVPNSPGLTPSSTSGSRNWHTAAQQPGVLQ
jgi:hypothetical protein